MERIVYDFRRWKLIMSETYFKMLKYLMCHGTNFLHIRNERTYFFYSEIFNRRMEQKTIFYVLLNTKSKFKIVTIV